MESLLDHPIWTLAFASIIAMGAGTPRSSLLAGISFRNVRWKVVSLLFSTPSVVGLVVIFRDDTAGITIRVVAVIVIVVTIAKFG